MARSDATQPKMTPLNGGCTVERLKLQWQ